MMGIKIIHENFSESIILAKFLSLNDPDVFKYEYLTYIPDKHVYVSARDADHNIVGSQALMPYVLNINGTDILTGRSERTLVAKELRGLNIFKHLYDECIREGREKGLQFVWGTTAAVKAFQKVGFIFHHNYFEHSICCIKPFLLIPYCLSENTVSKKFKLAQLLTAPLSMASRVLNVFHKRPTSIEIVNEIKTPDDFNHIYGELRKQGPLVHLVQDERFLRWAYQLDYRRSYLRLYAYCGSKLRAYIHVDLSHPTIARLVDFAEAEQGMIGYLLTNAKERLKQTKHNTIHATYNFKNLQLRKAMKTLYANGFIPISREGHKCIRPIDFIDMNILGDIRPWYITEIWNTLYKQG
jgi:GNAT superfamily N-acetyltransferase